MANLPIAPYGCISRTLAETILNDPDVLAAANACGGPHAVIRNLWSQDAYPQDDLAPYVVIQADSPIADAHVIDTPEDGSRIAAVTLRITLATPAADTPADRIPLIPGDLRAAPEALDGPPSEAHEAFLTAVLTAVNAAPYPDGWAVASETVRTDLVAAHPLQISAIDLTVAAALRTCSGRPISAGA